MLGSQTKTCQVPKQRCVLLIICKKIVFGSRILIKKLYLCGLIAVSIDSQTTEYNMTNNETQFILYQLPEEEGVIQVVVKEETIWATRVLKEYIRKGYALDDNRLKNLGGGGYWKELLERIRDIRSSEKVSLTASVPVGC